MGKKLEMKIMKKIKLLPRLGLFLVSLFLVVSCNGGNFTGVATEEPIVMGYSSWAGWWPWAIAEEEGLFEKHGINVDLRWFDSYTASLDGLAAGQLDANCQTLNDTIAFAGEAMHGEVAVVVNDNSTGNDKIVATKQIQSIQDLAGKDVGVEAGVVDDFLLSRALDEAGMSRGDVNIVDLETQVAANAFAAERVDAMGAYPPFWLTALEREGSHELISSADFPGAIPDLLVTSKTLIDQHPEQVQALVDTWFDILAFREENPERANEIILEQINQQAELTREELELFEEGITFFDIEDNLEAFSDGDNLTHMPYAAQEIAGFLQELDFIVENPDLDAIFDAQFVENYAQNQ